VIFFEKPGGKLGKRFREGGGTAEGGRLRGERGEKVQRVDWGRKQFRGGGRSC